MDGEDITIEEWIQEMEGGLQQAHPLMVGLSWAALFGTLLGLGRGTLFFYILHWGMK